MGSWGAGGCHLAPWPSLERKDGGEFCEQWSPFWFKASGASSGYTETKRAWLKGQPRWGPRQNGVLREGTVLREEPLWLLQGLASWGLLTERKHFKVSQLVFNSDTMWSREVKTALDQLLCPWGWGCLVNLCPNLNDWRECALQKRDTDPLVLGQVGLQWFFSVLILRVVGAIHTGYIHSKTNVINRLYLHFWKSITTSVWLLQVLLEPQASHSRPLNTSFVSFPLSPHDVPTCFLKRGKREEWKDPIFDFQTGLLWGHYIFL